MGEERAGTPVQQQEAMEVNTSSFWFPGVSSSLVSKSHLSPKLSPKHIKDAASQTVFISPTRPAAFLVSLLLVSLSAHASPAPCFFSGADHPLQTQNRREEDCSAVRASGFPKGRGGATGFYRRDNLWKVNGVVTYWDTEKTNYILWCSVDNTWVISPTMNIPANAVGDVCVGLEASLPTASFVELFESTWQPGTYSGSNPSVVCDTSGLTQATDDDDDGVLLGGDSSANGRAGSGAGLSATAIAGIIVGVVILLVVLSIILYKIYCPSHVASRAAAVQAEEAVIRDAIVRAVSARHVRQKSARSQAPRLPRLRTSVPVRDGGTIVDLPPLLPPSNDSSGSAVTRMFGARITDANNGNDEDEIEDEDEEGDAWWAHAKPAAKRNSSSEGGAVQQQQTRETGGGGGGGGGGGSGGGGGAAEVHKLMELRDQGVLSEDEFTAAKKKALGI